MKLTLEKRIAHGDHPALKLMMDNVHIWKDPAGNIKPDKEKSIEKIDGAGALIMNYFPIVEPVQINNRNVLVIWAPGGENRSYNP